MINDSAGYNKYFFELNRTFIPLLLLEFLEKLILTWELKVPKPSFNDSSLEDVFENIDFEKILSILKSRIPEYYHLVAFNYFIYKSELNKSFVGKTEILKFGNDDVIKKVYFH